MRWDCLAYEVTIRPWEHFMHHVWMLSIKASLLFVDCINPETHNVFPPKSLNNIKHHHNIYVVCNYVMQNIFND